MFCSYFFWTVLSLSGILSNFRVCGCDFNCTDKPVFTPSKLVVQFGMPASANCSACQHACQNKSIGLEKSIGEQQKNGRNILWTVDKMNAYPSSVTCYYNKGNGSHCCSRLPITVYQYPKKVEVGFRDLEGPMLEGQRYPMYCHVVEAAPLRNLIVIFYQGGTEVSRQHLKDNMEKKPANMTFYNSINATKENNGARYECIAQLDAEPDKPPYETRSNIFTTDVLYKPQFDGPVYRLISLTVGDPLHLNCSAEGNPRPSVRWELPLAAAFEGDVFSVDSVTTEHKGEYTCSINNSMGRTTVVFNVDVRVNYMNMILAVVAAVVVLVVIATIAVYVHCYRLSRTGKYNLKDVLRFRTPHIALPAEEL
ncbi:Fc receptor-like protein 1 [Syngnathus typhle]